MSLPREKASTIRFAWQPRSSPATATFFSWMPRLAIQSWTAADGHSPSSVWNLKLQVPGKKHRPSLQAQKSAGASGMGFSSSPSFDALAPKWSTQVRPTVWCSEATKKLAELVEDIAAVEDRPLGVLEPEQLNRAVVDLVHQRPELKRIVEVVFGQEAQGFEIGVPLVKSPKEHCIPTIQAFEVQRPTEPPSVFDVLEPARHPHATAQKPQIQVDGRGWKGPEMGLEGWKVEAASIEGDPDPAHRQSLWKLVQVSAPNKQVQTVIVENAGDGRLEQRAAFGLDVEERRLVFKLPVQPPVFPGRNERGKLPKIPLSQGFARLFDFGPRQGVDPLRNGGSPAAGGKILPGGDSTRPEVLLAPRPHPRNQLKSISDHQVAARSCSISGRSASQKGSALISRGCKYWSRCAFKGLGTPERICAT